MTAKVCELPSRTLRLNGTCIVWRLTSLGQRHRLSWLRMAVLAELDPRERPHGLSKTNKVLCGLILTAVISAAIETEPTISDSHQQLFRLLELSFGALFATELLVRWWSAAGEAKTIGEAWKSRVRWLFSVPTLIDVLALSPTFFSAGSMPFYGLRLVRLLRILRIARLGRFSRAWKFLAKAIASRQDELLMTFVAALSVMLISSTALYVAEGDVQPEKFGSIPRAMWWALETLTTIGYGDVAPVTPLGKILAGMTAFLGIGLIAVPTGIIASAFTQAAHQGDNASQPKGFAQLPSRQVSPSPAKPSDSILGSETRADQ